MVYSESVKRSVKRTLNNKGGNKMLTINPVNMNSKRYVSFGEGNMNNLNSNVGVMSLDKKPSAKINFEKDMYITQKADSVQSNPIKAIGYNSQVFDQEEAAYEGFLSRNFTLCIIYHDIDTKETRTLAAMIKRSENIIPVVFLCEHPTREEIALLFSFHADDVIRKPLDTDILQARIKAVQSRYQPQRKKEVRT